MKRTLSVLIALVMGLMMLVGCGRPAAGGGGAAPAKSGDSKPASTNAADYGLKTKVTSDKKVTIRLAYDVAEAHPSHTAFVEKFKKPIEALSKGNITVELYPNSQLGSLAENLEAMRIGDLEMAALNDAVIGAVVPEFNLVGLPYLWTSIDAAHKALDGDFGQLLDKKLQEKTGIRNLAWGDVGFRNITNSAHTIKKPADLKGLKIRTMTNVLHVEYFTALGAIPTPMSFSELFTALQQKTVDGQENPTALIYNNALYEAQKYMSITEHVFTAVNMNIAGKFFDSLPKDYQELITEAAKSCMAEQRKLITEQNSSLADKIKAAGVEVTPLTAAEKDEFQKVARDTVYKTAAKNYGQNLIDMAAAHNKK